MTPSVLRSSSKIKKNHLRKKKRNFMLRSGHGGVIVIMRFRRVNSAHVQVVITSWILEMFLSCDISDLALNNPAVPETQTNVDTSPQPNDVFQCN